MKKAFLITATVLASLALIASIAAYFYWRSFEDTPQYSLALLIDSSRRGDDQAFAEFVDSDTVIENFLPQITSKAAEMYGRGMPPAVLDQLLKIASPILPIAKDRARTELPRLLRNETQRFSDVPFPAMVLGADKYLDIKIDGEVATVTSRLPEHRFEVQMKKNENRWKIVGVRDEALATRIAQSVGEQLIGAATNGDPKNAGKSLGVKDLESLIKQAGIFFE